MLPGSPALAGRVALPGTLHVAPAQAARHQTHGPRQLLSFVPLPGAGLVSRTHPNAFVLAHSQPSRGASCCPTAPATHVPALTSEQVKPGPERPNLDPQHVDHSMWITLLPPPRTPCSCSSNEALPVVIPHRLSPYCPVWDEQTKCLLEIAVTQTRGVKLSVPSTCLTLNPTNPPRVNKPTRFERELTFIPARCRGSQPTDTKRKFTEPLRQKEGECTKLDNNKGFPTLL